MPETDHTADLEPVGRRAPVAKATYRLTLVDAGDIVGGMSIRYSGVVRQVSVDIATALEDLSNNREPRSVPLGSGEVMVRPVNVEAPLTGGSFRVKSPMSRNFSMGTG